MHHPPMLIRFLGVGMYPTVASGCSAPAEGDEVMGFVQAWIGVASKPAMVDTILAVSNVFSAAHAPIMISF